eukprot:CAMPEP_0114569482 /NCGR_PEP_ID=MMETSP0114-20121206/16654_1 /TAXON_ID=31324 /ORGANISM="Goniomonas sp, Strain m" /LENGTH=97 /DNA_ID=CAMNT_0001756373 /DNA_START=160 /DNA_END=453 /DNA_ORIENTATION=-
MKAFRVPNCTSQKRHDIVSAVGLGDTPESVRVLVPGLALPEAGGVPTSDPESETDDAPGAPFKDAAGELPEPEPGVVPGLAFACVDLETAGGVTYPA